MKFASILALLLLSVACSNPFKGISEEKPQHLPIQDVCSGKIHLQMVQLQSNAIKCKILVDGKVVGFVDWDGKVLWPDGKLDPACEAKISRMCQ